MSSFEVKIHRIAVEEHPNADRLQIGRIIGQDYTFVVAKDAFVTGDLFIYIPEAAIVPDWLLEEMGLVGKLNGAGHNRVKAQKFRGVLSQGLAYRPQIDNPDAPETALGDPASCALFAQGESWYIEARGALVGTEEGWEQTFDILPWSEGQDVGELLGIVKYEPEIPARFAGVWGPAPNHSAAPGGSLWQGYTHLENIKKYPHILEDGETVVMTEKIHGTSLQTMFDAEDNMLYVSSLGIARRGYTLEEDDDNVYWNIAHRYGLASVLKEICENLRLSQVMLFGEIAGVQDLTYGLKDGATSLYVFDILAKDARTGDKVWLDHASLVVTCNSYGLPMAPVVYEGPFDRDLLKTHTEGKTLVKGATHIREGVVVRPIQERTDPHFGRVVLKSISGDYLTRKEGTEYQ